MLDFSEFFPRKGSRTQKGSRSRVIGSFDSSKLLFSVNNSKETSVELVSPDGDSATALQFNEYMDIINADLSSDFEVLHITRRITSQKGFAFSSIFYHIHSPAKSREFVSQSPISAFFLPESSSPDYYLLHVVDRKMTQIHIQLKKSSITVEPMKGGVNIKSLISYTFNREQSTLTVIHEVKNNTVISEFNLENLKTVASIPAPIFIHPLSKLPPELALSPLSPMHLPYFRTTCNRILPIRYNDNLCIIQQLFENVDSFMQFSINMYPRLFSTIITVPNVRADLPLCYQQFGSIVFLFIVNQFICVIDIAQNPPFTSMQMNPFAAGFLSDCSAVLPIDHHLIDLNTGEIYNVTISLNNYQIFTPLMDKTKWDLMAIICARIQDSTFISSIIKLLYSCNDPLNVVYVIRRIFHFLQCNILPEQPKRRKKIIRQSSTGVTIPDRVMSPPPIMGQPPGVGSFGPGSLRTNIMPLSQTMSAYNLNDAAKTHVHKMVHRKDLSQSILDRLNEIELEFPSASLVPRRRTYRKLLNKMVTISKSHKKIEEAARKAIAKLEEQDATSLMFRNCLDIWSEEEKPEKFWQFIIYFSFLSETILNDFPSIMVLRSETENLFDEIGPDPMFRAFRAHHVFNATSARRNKAEEVNYWRERVLNEDSTSSDSDNEDSSSSPNKRSSSSLAFSDQIPTPYIM